jgi:hypothetical protein
MNFMQIATGWTRTVYSVVYLYSYVYLSAAHSIAANCKVFVHTALFIFIVQCILAQKIVLQQTYNLVNASLIFILVRILAQRMFAGCLFPGHNVVASKS